MSAETELYTALTNDSAVAALVATRIYPSRVPLGTTYPAIGYSMITSGLNGSNNCQISRLQVDVFDSTYSGAKAIRDAVIALVNSLQNWAYIQGSDIYEDDTQVHHQNIDVIISH